MHCLKRENTHKTKNKSTKDNVGHTSRWSGFPGVQMDVKISTCLYFCATGPCLAFIKSVVTIPTCIILF